MNPYRREIILRYRGVPFIAIIFVLINLIVDVLYTLINPKVRAG